jgi:hypothetical protein
LIENHSIVKRLNFCKVKMASFVNVNVTIIVECKSFYNDGLELEKTNMVSAKLQIFQKDSFQ